MIIVDRTDGRVKVETHGEDCALITEAAMVNVTVARKVMQSNKACKVNDILELIVNAAIGIDAALCMTDSQGGGNPSKT